MVYKSPVRKLMKFFEESRDKWKAKCQSAKKQVKALKNRVRSLERKVAQMREQALELETRLAEMAFGREPRVASDRK